MCELTARQRRMYRALKDKISVSELLEKATSLADTESMNSLMNLVMQFRKVCNHPELFERADVESPLALCNFSMTPSISREGDNLQCRYTTQSVIKYRIPKQLYRRGGMMRVPNESSPAGSETRYLDNLLNIWQTSYIHESAISDEPCEFSSSTSTIMCASALTPPSDSLLSIVRFRVFLSPVCRC